MKKSTGEINEHKPRENEKNIQKNQTPYNFGRKDVAAQF